MRSNRINEALYGKKYRHVASQNSSLQVDGSEYSTTCCSPRNDFTSFVIDYTKERLVVKSKDGRCHATMSMGTNHGESNLDFADRTGSVFRQLKVQVRYVENGYRLHYFNSRSQQIAVLEVNVSSMKVDFVPTSFPNPSDSSTALDNWEDRWNNCMRERIRSTFNNPVDLGFFIGAGVIIPWIGMNLGCAWEATFPNFQVY